MNAIKLLLLLLFNILYVSDCVRRIQGGNKVTSQKSYMVYLVAAPTPPETFNDWLCGGVLVNPWFIISARDCVNEIDYMYAIAGYDTYVTEEQIEVDECTREKKKKVVYYCVPKYKTNDGEWSLIDIALLKVESPYNFKDHTYKKICSYIPSSIPINYQSKFQDPGRDGLVLGWGHTEDWRQTNDDKNYNEKYLRYASIRIMDKKACKHHYKQYANVDINFIDNYMICTSEKGDLDEHGKIVFVGQPPVKLDGCKRGVRLSSYDNEPCDEDEVLMSNPTNDSNIITKNKTRLTNETRKSGICQNDHGGPLVTWVGGKEVLIGVASVFGVSDDAKCMAPYVYTSTVCNGVFLDCVLSDSDLPNKIRRDICDRPPIERGYDTDEKHISWKDHPAGPADNEVSVSDRLKTKAGVSKELKGTIQLDDETIAIRPQRPLEQ